MTRAGRAYAPATSGQLIEESGSSSWHTDRPPETYSLLPTPVASDGQGGQHVAVRRAGGHQVDLSDLVITIFSCRTSTGQGRPNSSGSAGWGRYEHAIRHWEAITGRIAPNPTETGTRGQPRLSATFSEWLMGLPAGFVTALDLPYTAQHKVIGNGVVTQQAVAALHQLVCSLT